MKAIAKYLTAINMCRALAAEEAPIAKRIQAVERRWAIRETLETMGAPLHVLRACDDHTTEASIMLATVDRDSFAAWAREIA